MGHLSVAYIDDSYLQADFYHHCVQNVIDTVAMFDNLGLVVHPKKICFGSHTTIGLSGFHSGLYFDENYA